MKLGTVLAKHLVKKFSCDCVLGTLEFLIIIIIIVLIMIIIIIIIIIMIIIIIPLEHSLTRVVGVTLTTFRHTSWCLLQENKMLKKTVPASY